MFCLCVVLTQEEARQLRQALTAADRELAAHQELQAAGDAHAAAGRQALMELLQPVQQRAAPHRRQRRDC